MRLAPLLAVALGAALFVVAPGGCTKKDDPAATVVVYTSVDEPIATPILRDFEKATGIKVVIKTDAEATKSAGLAETLEAERANPRADVFWGNEVFYTINLANRGLLAPYDSPTAADVAPAYRDPQQRWTGHALRVRVLALTDHADGAAATANVRSLQDLTHPALKGRIAMARPSAGTTGGHVAALLLAWGDDKFDAYFRALKENDVKLVGGNSEVVKYTATGDVWAGLTDNDDVANARANGSKLREVVPDQADGAPGTLAIPCTVALVAGAKHPENAKKLIDYLLSRQTEQKLIDASFARYSTRAPATTAASTPPPFHPLPTNYPAAAAKMPEAIARALKILEGR